MGDPVELLRRVEEALRGVKCPGGSGESVVDVGLVSRLRISRDLMKLAVMLNFAASASHCPFCRFVSQTLISKLADDVIEAVKGLGFSEVIVLDAVTGEVYRVWRPGTSEVAERSPTARSAHRATVRGDSFGG